MSNPRAGSNVELDLNSFTYWELNKNLNSVINKLELPKDWGPIYIHIRRWAPLGAMYRKTIKTILTKPLLNVC